MICGCCYAALGSSNKKLFRRDTLLRFSIIGQNVVAFDHR
jgi:hypothetical protein